VSFNRSLVLLIVLSFFAAFALCVLAARYNPPGGAGGSRGGYAVLVTGAAVPDKTLRELLVSCEGNFAGPPVSESGQWALLDAFSGITPIPLDEYESRVAPFDPRNDGYAQKLRSFFVRDGKRFVFIPLRPGVKTLEKDLAAALGAIPFSVEYLGFGKPVGFFMLLFAAAAVFPLVRCLAGRFRPRQERDFDDGRFLPGLAVLSSLAFCGAPGFLLCALFAGLAALSGDLVYPRGSRPGRRSTVAAPFNLRWLFVPPLLAGSAALVIFSGVSPLLALGVFAAHTFLCVFFQKIVSLPRAGGHVRFAPVLILKPAPLSGVCAAGKQGAALMLPFVLAALLAALFAPVMPGARRAASLSAAFPAELRITEADYRAHAAFQASFSIRPLGRDSAGTPGDASVPGYTRDSDGLISPVSKPLAVPEDLVLPQEFPPFPLQALMEFLGK
jgi:hypothetical protein